MARTYYQRPKRLDKLNQKDKLDLLFDFIHAFTKLKKPSDSSLFLQDILTANEIRNISMRLRIAKLLLSGSTFKEIQNDLHVSSATITKVSFWLEQKGEGLKNVISKLPIRYEMPAKLPRGPIEFYLPQLIVATAQTALVKKQEKQIKKTKDFQDSIGEKQIYDRELQASFDEEYREKARLKKIAELKKK